MYKYIFCLLSLLFLTNCTEPVDCKKQIDAYPPVFPDYMGVTIPPNIAPLNFALPDSVVAESSMALFVRGENTIVVDGKNGRFTIPPAKWKRMLEMDVDKPIEIQIVVCKNGEWFAYKSFTMEVAAEPIDPYLAYRLIEPGYELWNKMGIYQRNMETYEESAVYENKMTDENCVNCHSFCMQNPEKMLFHMRDTYPGTILIDGDKIEKLNTKTEQTISSLVYPSWHPSGKYVAFSVNNTKQAFHTNHQNRIEVFDLASDVVVYDVEKYEVITTSSLFSDKQFETFPTFSPDGETLFFCSASAVSMPDNFEKVKYSLCSISFDPASRTFGALVDTLYNASEEGQSVSFPRVSPDGRFLLYTRSGYGNFSIWHKDADLYLMDLSTKTGRCLDVVNSEEVESYHSWSSNSRWFVFSSRRLDGLYTRPFIAYVDTAGNVQKPFLLPQKSTDFYQECMKSYNIPEFVTGKIPSQSRKIALKAKEDNGMNVTFQLKK